MPGPLSPGYAAQVPYNYNQLEGRFKQLQGKSVRVFWRCCHALILVNMLVQACSHCTKVLERTKVVLWEEGYCVALHTPKVSRTLPRVKVCVQPLSPSALQMRTKPDHVT